MTVGCEILSGLLAQVGAVYRTRGFGRDSSREDIIGQRDKNLTRPAAAAPGCYLSGFQPAGNRLDPVG